MKTNRTRLIAAIATGVLAMTRIASATIQLTTAGYTNDFSVDTVAGDWITSSSNIAGTETTFTDVASIDTFVVTNNYNASGLTTALGTSATDPPSANALARRNTTRQFVQMRPPSGGKAATVLVARLQNATGGTVPSLDVSYNFSNPGTGDAPEEVPGWQAYYSITGNSNWIKIPAFSTATPGLLSANLNFGGSGWPAGALLHILWVDDNAAAANEDSYAMDDFSVQIPSVPIITATVANAVRNLGANPADPSDDTVTFDVTIGGSNLPPASPGWTTTGAIPNPPVTGAYNTTVTVPNVPFSSLPLTIGLADQSNPSIVSSFTVNAANLPHYLALSTIGTPSYVLLDPSSATQWVGNGGTFSIQQNNGGGITPFVAQTNPLTFAAGSEKYVTLTLEAQDTSTGSNFELSDTLKIELVTDVGTTVLTRTIDKDNSGTLQGQESGAYDATPLADEFNPLGKLIADTYTQAWHLRGTIPANATSAQLVISGVNNSATEFYRVMDVRFGVEADADGDGAATSYEIAAGTDPNDRNSVLQITSQDTSGGNYTLTVPSVLGRDYQVQTSTDLVTWTSEGAAQVGTGTEIIVATPADVAHKFVRVLAF